MGFLFFWVGTSAISFYMEIQNGLRIFKDAADAGYKIDVTRMSQIMKELYPDNTKVTLVTLLIPVYNVMQVYKKAIQYNEVRPLLLDQLDALGVLEEMTEKEKREYAKRPTGLNAVIIPIKSEIKTVDVRKIKVDDGDLQGEIYYTKGKSYDAEDITIVKTTGNVSKLSPKEQKTKVTVAIINTTIDAINKYGIDKYEKVLQIKKDDNESKTSEERSTENDTKLDNETAIRALENYKRYIIEEANKSIVEEKGPTLKKEMKK